MRILTISPRYSDEERSAYAFVHARSKIYQKFRNKVKVFVPSKTASRYQFEGVSVYKGPERLYRALLKEFCPDVVAIHSPRYTMSRNPLKMLADTERQAPIVMWIHGVEALINAFHHYLPPWQVPAIARSILGGALKITALRFLIQRASAIVYVSNWMRSTAENYLWVRHPHSVVIPNPIDTTLFSYRKRKPQFTSRGIAVRGLTWKYGVDIAIKAYSNLKGTSLAILGTGSLEDYMRNLAQRCRSNVTFLSKHVKHSMMPSLYKEYGYFVAPSRTEAQGVAMCEAMACGVPPIAARVGGIPDFVKDGINGMLIPPENPVALRKAIKRLLVDDQLYATLSVNGAKYMRANLSHKEIYRKEHRILRMCQERFTPKS